MPGSAESVGVMWLCPAIDILTEVDMGHTIALGPAKLGPAVPATLAERSHEAAQLDPEAGRMDDAQDPFLILMRYDEYIAQDALQKLFESGQLTCLGW
jgi:hypothetical protein